ncbi:hypothetical protein TWF506_003801 [Arthrobotrys conoides]|uniref:Uncharacterized protein n=1 Tax=Arthrobotrys conoides TaxID=74498 RepID=A0AAN8N7W1_9PEZI
MDHVVSWLSQTDDSYPAQDDISAGGGNPQPWPQKRKHSNLSEISDDRLQVVSFPASLCDVWERDQLQAQNRKNYHPGPPAPNSTFSDFDDGSAVVASSKQKRVLLTKSTPSFRFLGASGRGGLHIRDNFDKWVPPSIRQLIGSFRTDSSDRWVLCNCVKDLLCEEYSLGAIGDGIFQACSCNGNVKSSRQSQARGVLKSVRHANHIQAQGTEENNWVAHSIFLLQLVIGESGETYPLQVDSVTATDLYREFCPRVRWRPSRSRSSSPKKRQRGAIRMVIPSQTPLVDEVLTARADIAITLLNCDETESFRQNLNIKFGLSELPLPLKNMNQLPLLTFEVKSLDGSSLEAENQATICANSILQSWRCWECRLVILKPTTRVALRTLLLKLKTRRRIN